MTTRLDAAAIVLAGGKSSRMGRPKAFLPWGDEPLLTSIVTRLRTAFEEVRVVAAPDQPLPPVDIPVVRDRIAHRGPLGGMADGMAAVTASAVFVTSCDSAFLNVALVRHLVGRLEAADAVVPRWYGRVQPLHAVYRRVPALAAAEALLARGDLRATALLDTLTVCWIDDEEIREFDVDGLSFSNINTPEDYEQALRALGPAR